MGTPEKVVAVGFFDGVHRGHQAILAGADRALTFRRHPLSVLAPARAPRLLMSLDERLAAIRACGVREVVALDFTPELAALAPEEFLDRYLRPSDGAASWGVRCGANWNFGKGGVGNADWLRAHGVEVAVMPYADYEGAPVSSSRIRAALAAGDVAAADAMLGRPFRVRGVAAESAHKGVGTKLGYPTVNVMLPELMIGLPHGVYVVEVGGVRGLANYGVAPTMGARRWKEPVLEIHFVWQGCGVGSPRTPPAEGSLPEPPFEVDLLRFVRPERRFATVAELQAQIARDVAAVEDGGVCAP